MRMYTCRVGEPRTDYEAIGVTGRKEVGLPSAAVFFVVVCFFLKMQNACCIMYVNGFSSYFTAVGCS